MSTKKGRRLDKDRVTLRKGESQRADGIYDYRWSTPDGKRHAIYASTLEELREKEEQIIFIFDRHHLAGIYSRNPSAPIGGTIFITRYVHPCQRDRAAVKFDQRIVAPPIVGVIPGVFN